MYTVCLPGIFSLYAYRRTFSIHFFFYSLRLSLRSLTEEKGKEEEGLTYCVLLDLVYTFVLLWQKKRQEFWYREIHPSYTKAHSPFLFSHSPAKKGRETIGR